MPWRVSGVLEEKVRFVFDYDKHEWSMSELCRRYGISRETGYEVLRRFREAGMAGLCERSHAPLRHRNQTAAAIVERVVALRRQHPSWGARKLHAYLERKWPQSAWPAPSTIGDWLKSEGLIVPRRKRRKTAPYSEPFVALEGPNQVWCADFKGWFRTRNAERIDPFTLSDAYSRYLLRCQAVDRADTPQVRAVMETAFREFGMPLAIRTDNGAPFSSRAIAGLSRLAVYLMKLGIIPERIQPGHPEQNGRHERMHRTLQQETASPAAATRRDQQRAFDRFRQEYNQERPHEGLGQQTPASCYRCSPRPYPERVPIPEYDTNMQVRRVEEHGDIGWQGDRLFVSETLFGERIGLAQLNDRYYKVYFARFPIALLDNHKRQLLPLSQEKSFYVEGAGEGKTAPFPCTPSPTTKTYAG